MWIDPDAGLGNDIEGVDDPGKLAKHRRELHHHHLFDLTGKCPRVLGVLRIPRAALKQVGTAIPRKGRDRGARHRFRLRRSVPIVRGR